MMAPRTKQSRADGLVNLVSGLGIRGRDKSAGNFYVWNTELSPGVLDEMYRGSGLARRMIDLPVLEMTREWFKIEADPDELVNGELETIRAPATIREAQTWADLYGNAFIVMGLDDGSADLAEPANLERLRKVAFLTVYDRNQVTWTSADLYQNRQSRKYGTPEWYTIRPYTNLAAEQMRVHETRMLKFCGARVPPQQRRMNMGWDDSVLQSSWEQLRNYLAALAHSANLIEESNINALTIKNLIQLLAAKGGEDKVRQRLDIMDYSKSNMHSILLAEGETFERKSAALGGIPEVIDRHAQALAAARGIPISLFLGEPPSGLQATGEYLRDNWYDQVRAWQEEKLAPPLETLVRYEFLSKQGPTRGVEPANWKIVFNPLEQNDEKDEVTIRKMQAEVDVAYINAGVVTPEEIALSRFGGDRYSTETQIDVADHQPPTEEELAAEEAARNQAMAALQIAKQQPPAGNGAAGEG